jgi:hypothetical protein
MISPLLQIENDRFKTRWWLCPVCLEKFKVEGGGRLNHIKILAKSGDQKHRELLETLGKYFTPRQKYLRKYAKNYRIKQKYES